MRNDGSCLDLNDESPYKRRLIRQPILYICVRIIFKSQKFHKGGPVEIY